MINANISRDLHGLVTWCGMALFTGRETNFYGSPVIKGFVIIVTSSSFLYHMFRSVLPSNVSSLSFKLLYIKRCHDRKSY
jgi:hypothetical protein